MDLSGGDGDSRDLLFIIDRKELAVARSLAGADGEMEFSKGPTARNSSDVPCSMPPHQLCSNFLADNDQPRP